MKLRSSVFGWKSVWMELADEFGGEFTDGNIVTMRIPVEQSPWTLTFKHQESGLSHQQTTSVSAPYKSAKDFAFALHNKTWIEEAAKHFGLQDIVVGHEPFDTEFIIKGSDEELVRELFEAEHLRQHILLQKAVSLAIHKETADLSKYGSVPAGVHILSFHEQGAINSFDRLSGIYKMMSMLLHELCEIGIAHPKQPAFTV